MSDADHNHVPSNGTIPDSTDPKTTPTHPRTQYADPGTRFREAILFVLAGLPEDERYGAGLREALEDQYDDTVHHGQLYPNIEVLVDRGFIRREKANRRRKNLILTDQAYEYLDALEAWQAANRRREGGRDE